MNLITRYRKEMAPIVQALEHMPGGRKVIITDPQTELVELVYGGMKKQGGMLIIVDADIQDKRLNIAIQKIMLQARADHIGFGLVWSDNASSEEVNR